MKSNKIDALIYQIQSGKAKSDRAKILLQISKQPLTIEKLVLLGWKIQTASARCSELEEMGLIKKMYNPTNSFSWFTYIENKKDQEDARNMVADIKKTRYFATGIQKGYFVWDENGQIVANLQMQL
jgi:hypothetical protein